MAPSYAISSSWLLCLPLLLIPPIFVLLHRKRDKRELIKHPPGPLMFPTILCIFRMRLFGLPQLFLWQFSKKYGPIMLLQLGRLPTLVISSAEMAEQILKTQDLNFCTRFPLVCNGRFSYNYIDVVLGPYNEYWKQMRKIYILKLFSMKSVQSFRSVREEEVSTMINSIISSHQYSTSTKSLIVDLEEKLTLLTMDIFFRVVFGTSYQGRTTFGGCKFEKVIRETLETLGNLSAADFVPYVGWIIDIISRQHARLEKNFHDLDSHWEQFISEYLGRKFLNMEKSKTNEAIIDVLFGLEGDSLGGITLTRDHIKAVLSDIFIAGVDTSVVSTVWAMAELVKKPRIMKKVQDEVRSCVAKKGRVDESDLHQLQYLKMVIKETLRLHPPGPLLIARECMKQSKIKGYDIFPKTMVLVNVWAIGRDPEFWKNPELFVPERFMDTSIDFRGQDFHFLPFGAGRRGCPGIHMGNVIMELTLANLLYCFNWELPNGMKFEDLDMEEAGGFAIHKKSGLQLVPSPSMTFAIPI